MPRESEASRLSAEVSELQDRLADALSDNAALTRRVRDAPKRIRTLETRVNELKEQLATAAGQNDKLSFTLREARDHIAALREELVKLTRLPSAYGTVVMVHDDDTVDIVTAGRKMRVEITPEIDTASLVPGSEVLLNDSYNVIGAGVPDPQGEIVTIKTLMEGQGRAVVSARGDEERVVLLGAGLSETELRAGDLALMDVRAGVLTERIVRPEMEHLLLEDVPDVSYEQIGGLDDQIERIQDAVELPFMHPELFAEYRLPAPKGILLYGPPGCGKTLIAKAVANSLGNKFPGDGSSTRRRSHFINVKGPELLNKFVGETERQLRLVFQRAREVAQEGVPVIIFFDEMESLFRTRGTGISSDVESTIVPQLLAEIDGVETLRNVMVIGASNREDLIDPAILRPGRLDVKIKIDRPDRDAANRIFARYLTTDLPIHPDAVETDGGGDIDKAVVALIERTVDEMYAEETSTEFLEVTYQNGDREIMYFKDFASGAMIENIVRRAKTEAIKRALRDSAEGAQRDSAEGAAHGICGDDLVAAVRAEFAEHEDLPNTTNPDDWAKISGKKGERIAYVRTVVSHDDEGQQGGRAIDHVATGQYL